MSKPRKTFASFLDKNEELAEEYQQALGEDLWSLPISEIEDQAYMLASKLQMSFSSILNNSINHAIETETHLLEVLEGFNASDNLLEDGDSSIQKYFKEINKIYTENDNNYDIEYSPENRDRIISMNLKSVIAIAKCYQGLGIDFQDLISTGNEGLCRAWEKYDPARACLKENLTSAINELEQDEISFEQLNEVVSSFLKYGEVKKEFENKFKPGNIYTKKQILEWINKKVQNAKFNSVACKWIKAYIVQEINSNSRIVKKPKTEIDKDRTETGSYKREVKVNIDAPIGGDENSKSIGDVLTSEDEGVEKESLENEENYKIFKNGLKLLLDGVKSRDRRIILKKFGIGMPRPMQPNEIAAQEALSVARISQIINSTLQQMIENSKKYKIDKNELFAALERLV